MGNGRDATTRILPVRSYYTHLFTSRLSQINPVWSSQDTVLTLKNCLCATYFRCRVPCNPSTRLTSSSSGSNSFDAGSRHTLLEQATACSRLSLRLHAYVYLLRNRSSEAVAQGSGSSGSSDCSSRFVFERRGELH